MHRRTRKIHHHHRHNDNVHYNTVGEYCDTTFHGLTHWYKHMFTHLGWMILAKDRGMIDQTSTYLNSMKRLKNALQHKIKSMREHDKKEDLKIMLHNLCILCKHAEKDL
jgi:hypothetical protein